MYREIGLTPTQSRVYEYLVEHPSAAAEDLGNALGMDRPAVARTLRRLGALGLLVPGGDTADLALLPPELALEALIRRREGRLQELRLRSAELAERHRRAAARRDAGPDVVEVVRGRHAVAARVDLLERHAVSGVDILSTPPYLGGFVPSEEELALSRRGVPARVVYSRQALEMDGAGETVRRLREAGEQARVLAEVPMKLLIVDRRTALVPLTTGEQAAAVVVHPSVLLDALVALFGTLWQRARPLDGAPGGARAASAAAQERQLVDMLAAGLKDETVARHLGLGLRTARRRIAVVMERLGASTRFEAGYLLGGRAAAAEAGRRAARPHGAAEG
ncbi:helix-turn-helix domain-containing protein [Kitasatospora sp. NPDC059571]|uniref:helix-turn-helix domain-containing protein n=1 Tax=Kitasatospora sp. NPDC059571 TaxID=3346871 RepID=UPI003685603D